MSDVSLDAGFVAAFVVSMVATIVFVPLLMKLAARVDAFWDRILG